MSKEFSILIVDDEKMNVDILGGILSSTYNLLIARNGTLALQLAKERKPDLILLDVLMPDMSGFDVLEKLNESGETKKIPVIFITGLTSNEDEEKGFFLGAVDYITKPFRKAIVEARVRTHIKIIEQARIIERLSSQQ
jgi:PleD family two-component response regulator